MPRPRDRAGPRRSSSAVNSPPLLLNRRAVLGQLGAGLGGGLAGWLLYGRGSAAQTRRRSVVTTSWYLTELLLSLDVVPQAISDTAAFRDRLPNVPLPDRVVDLGAVWEPNLELLQQLAPDLILLPPEQLVNEAILKRIAPTRVVPLPERPMAPLDIAFWTWREVAGWLDLTPEAEVFALSVGRKLTSARVAARVAARSATARPVYLVDIRRGGRLIDVFGPNSILHDVLLRLGFRNAWTAPVDDYGWTTTGIARLTDPEAAIVYFDDGEAAPRSRRLLEKSALWRGLPAARAGRIIPIPEVFVFGGLLTATRFADLLLHHLAEPTTTPHG